MNGYGYNTKYSKQNDAELHKDLNAQNSTLKTLKRAQAAINCRRRRREPQKLFFCINLI